LVQLIPAQQDVGILYITIQLAEVAGPQKLFAASLSRTEVLRPAGASG
jgi:hypothetical protein